MRTPADGQEAPEDGTAATVAAVVTTKPATVVTTTTTSTPLSVKSSIPQYNPSLTRAPIPFARSSGVPPPVPAKPGSSATETSTVFINTSEIPIPAATQPTVQKRVVTHVTIFPSPPPDLVTQISRVQTTSIPPAPPKPVVTSKVEAKPLVEAPQLPQAEVPPPPPQTQASTPPQVPPPPPITPDELEKETEPVVIPPPLIPEPEPEPEQEPEQEPQSELESTLSIEDPSAQVGSVIKSEPEVSLHQSSSTEMVNKEPLSSTSEKDASSTQTAIKGGSGSGGGTGGGSSGDESSALLLAKHWGPERLVQVHREPGKSLGISIVGGKVDLYNAGPDSGSAISGIFIKNVLLNSPAGRTGQLKVLNTQLALTLKI